ncbi:hypothetical protein Metvu_1214 [Methanocaldococcus vulcanius M7]|uniref:Uncharacterized protein n=1 Tax=Methanocaldococcus vulcanius (strain ATCC 700851 / DSM 12094 / M7) TaxID=579137 RepID=C9RHL9_METVM|nr:hypothetical protein [Methanocaldococcus vulcanius]ACX73071.1 hypothetical protein Metvu_1214 [Methanocaldococcus vulcanius M7]
MDSIMEIIENIEVELYKLKAELMPVEIPEDEGFEKITEEKINKYYEDLKNPELWVDEEEFFRVLNEDNDKE